MVTSNFRSAKVETDRKSSSEKYPRNTREGLWMEGGEIHILRRVGSLEASGDSLKGPRAEWVTRNGNLKVTNRESDIRMTRQQDPTRADRGKGHGRVSRNSGC